MVLAAPAADERSQVESRPGLVRWAGEIGEDCPPAAEVDAWIERALGHGLAPDSPLEGVSIEVAPDPRGGLRGSLELSWSDETERRTLRGESCHAVARASAVIVAVALDPLAIAEEVIPEPSSEPEPSPEPASPSTPSPENEKTPPVEPSKTAPEDIPRRQPQWSHRLRVAGGIDYGTLPSIGGVATVGYGAARGLARLEAAVLYRTPTSARYPDMPSVGGSFQLIAGTLRACPRFVTGRLEVPVCGGVEAGSLRARGRADLVEVKWKPWLAATADATAVIDLGRRIALVVAVGTAVPLIRSRFHITGLPPLFRVGPVGLRSLLGLEIRLTP